MEMGFRKRFCEKIYGELQNYKVETMAKSKEEIFESSYKTEVINTFYEVLVASASLLSENLLMHLIGQSTNVLESLYEDFVCESGEDELYLEVQEHVKEKLDIDWRNC